MAQSFSTVPVGLGSQTALYQLSIRRPGGGLLELATYTFPLTPSQVRADIPALSTFGDVQGPSKTQGVTRVADTYGLAPPVFTVEGTTGWDRHLSDGYVLTGLQSVQFLQKFLGKYASLNEALRASGSPDRYSLEFYIVHSH